MKSPLLVVPLLAICHHHDCEAERDEEDVVGSAPDKCESICNATVAATDCEDAEDVPDCTSECIDDTHEYESLGRIQEWGDMLDCCSGRSDALAGTCEPDVKKACSDVGCPPPPTTPAGGEGESGIASGGEAGGEDMCGLFGSTMAFMAATSGVDQTGAMLDPALPVTFMADGLTTGVTYDCTLTDCDTFVGMDALVFEAGGRGTYEVTYPPGIGEPAPTRYYTFNWAVEAEEVGCAPLAMSATAPNGTPFMAYRIFYVFTTDSYNEPLDGVIRFAYVVLGTDGQVLLNGITYEPV